MTIPLPSLSDSLSPISSALDAVTSAERVNWMRGLGKKELVALWKLADGHPLLVEHFHGAEGQVVIHEGQNSLPAFNAFQKRFVLRAGVVQGYNHQSMAWITGPGHFTVTQAGAEVLLDYLSEPKSVPSEFPALKANDAGFSRLVYMGMHDFCRRVSEHVIIGEARKGGKPTGDYFMLCKTA